VWGDRSCDELPGVVHCQNCPVFASAGRRLLDRPAPPGYLEAWHERVLTPMPAPAAGERVLVVFRIGAEWLALPASCVREIVDPRPVHRVPHRTSDALLGLVNVGGELRVCLALGAIIGAAPAANAASTVAHAWARMLVIEHGRHAWVFPVDEVRGIQRVAGDALGRPPVTIERGSPCWVEGVFAHDEDRVGLLDHELVCQRAKELCA
jgi:chemotaxis-related protein WspD